MVLKLNKPICFFDLETTGVQVATDRIVEISILKVWPDGNKESVTWRVNPEQPIPAQATEIHGIDDDMVADQPNFKTLAPKVIQMIKDSDLAGFNSNRFDIPLLAEELLRADMDIDLRKNAAIDVQTIFHKMEKRTLTAAYKFYCDKDLEQAHSAEADTKATYEVLLAQLERYPELNSDVASLAEFSAHRKTADFAGYIQYDENGQEIFTFGKHKGTPVVKVLEQEPGYFGWLLNADFPRYTKKVLTQIKLRALNTKSDS
jgi:DNA polymerase-3 subunit epsilon